MKVPHLAAARKYLGANAKVLNNLFEVATGTPPGVRVDRYRADHPDWIDALDRLESSQNFLGRQRANGELYYLRVFALPLLVAPRAEKLLKVISDLYSVFGELYRERLTQQILVTELLELCEKKFGISDEALVKDALFYMADSHSIWSGLSANFPYSRDAYLCISEHVLREKRFEKLIGQFYEWHIVNPKRRARDANVSGLPFMAAPPQRRRAKRHERARSRERVVLPAGMVS
jgi:hypothetical protein